MGRRNLPTERRHLLQRVVSSLQPGAPILRRTRTFRRSAARFPKVSAKEIRQAVDRAGDAYWSEVVKQVRSPNEDPVSVGISTLRVRILVQEETGWREIHLIEFNLPMGC